MFLSTETNQCRKKLKKKKCLNKYTNLKLYISYSNLKKTFKCTQMVFISYKLQLILLLGIILHIVIVYQKAIYVLKIHLPPSF